MHRWSIITSQGTISVGIDATDLFDRYEEDYEDAVGGIPHIEINRMQISQSIEVHDWHICCLSIVVGKVFDLVLVFCDPLQAPLTTKDTAILSGSLSTHNGNGGGTINLALRRVTSAKGWGEVGFILTVTGHVCHKTVFRPCCRKYSDVSRWRVSFVVCFTQIELGAGDTHGPLFGMKIFRNLTPRWYV